MRPLVRSYGVISTRTWSPASTRMRFLRIRPAVWAMISCSFSSLTRNVAFGSSSVTTPGNSNSSSFAIDIRVRVRRSPFGSRASCPRHPRMGAEASGNGGVPQHYGPRSGTRSFIAPGLPRESRLDALHELVSHVPVGVEPLFAVAGYDGRIRRRPIFDLD